MLFKEVQGTGWSEATIPISRELRLIKSDSPGKTDKHLK